MVVVRFNPVSTFGLPLFPQQDASGTLYWIEPWGNPQFNTFKQTFKRQCLRWNDQFWLSPPAGFSQLDVKVGTRTVRPNIYCHLYIDLVVGSAAAGHVRRIVKYTEK